MSKQQNITVFGIDLGTTNSCIAYANESGIPNIVPNNEGERTTPSVVLFEDNDRRVVGKEAKNNAVLNPNQTVDVVKRHMGEPGWRFGYNGAEHSAEEISSYILRKLAQDAEQSAGITVRDVVITCPAYFGIAERKATEQAGKLAGFNVREIINEPTAAAIMYGFQNENEQDQVVLVYDLGGGTFDITVIEIKGGAITVVATGGDYKLGGRNWDERVVMYLAKQWQQQTGSNSDPTESAETLQDLWFQAERAKHSLSARQGTQVPVSHEGMRKSVPLSRDKFNELTASLLEQTISFTKSTMDEARRKRDYIRFDKILLVGGSTKMPQVKERLEKEFKLPLQLFDPDEAVAKGAAIYGQKLVLDQKIVHQIAEFTGTNPEQVDVERTPEHIKARAQQEVARDSGMRIGSVKKLSGITAINVASHSFGIVTIEKPTYKEKISNLVLVNDPLPAKKTQTFHTFDDNQETVDLRIMENSLTQPMIPDLSAGQEIGKANLPLPPGLPENAPIEVTFELYRDGRLHVIGREPTSNNIIEADIQTSSDLSEAEKQEAKIRSNKVTVS